MLAVIYNSGAGCSKLNLSTLVLQNFHFEILNVNVTNTQLVIFGLKTKNIMHIFPQLFIGIYLKN